MHLAQLDELGVGERRRGAARRQPRHQSEDAVVVDDVGALEAGDERAAPGHRVDETLVGQLDQRLPHRQAADPERVADLVLVDLGARREPPGEDLLAQVVGGRVLQARVAHRAPRRELPRQGGRWSRHSYTTLAVGEVGRPWHVSTHPSSTSSGIRRVVHPHLGLTHLEPRHARRAAARLARERRAQSGPSRGLEEGLARPGTAPRARARRGRSSPSRCRRPRPVRPIGVDGWFVADARRRTRTARRTPAPRRHAHELERVFDHVHERRRDRRGRSRRRARRPRTSRTRSECTKPCSVSRWCTTSNRSPCSATSASSSARKITDRASRFA